MSNDNNTNIEIKKFYLADMFEKHQAIANELDNLLQILNFYAPNSSNTEDKNCLGFKDSCNLMKSDIIKIKKELDEGYNDIYKKINNESEAFIRIIYYDNFRVLTTNILKALESIGRKLFQLLEDDLNQYIPYPKHNKRFSSKALTEFLQTEYNNIYQNFNTNNKNDLKILLYWGYREYFKIKNHKNRENQYIRLSFYHHEISSTLPILAHEVFHLLIKNSDENNEVIQLKNTIQEELSKNSIVINFLSDIESLAEEVVCDFYAYLVHKESYILSLYQEILGIGFYDKFVVSNSEKEPINIMYTNLTDGDEAKLINGIIRLLVLSNHYFEYTKNGNEELNKYIQILYKEIENMSNYLIQSYKISSHLNKDADYFFKSIDKTEDIILEKLNNKNTTINNNNIAIAKVYQKFWKIRLNYIKEDKVPYKGYIRYLILKKTLKLSDDKNRYHLLTMYKYRFGEDNKNFFDFIKDKDKNKDEDKDKDFAFGIYNACKLIKKDGEESFKKEEKEKEEKEKEEKNKEFFFYTRKYPLIKISEKDNGGNGLFNLIMFVEINDSCSLNTIKESYEYIKKYLNKDNDSDIKNYTIFKSLGPMDFLIYIEKIDIDKLWEIKEHFITNNKFEYIKRTHTIISCQLPSENIEPLIDQKKPKQDSNQLSSEKTKLFIFKTTLRIKTDAKDWEDKLFNLKNSNGKKIKFKSYLTPGVQDVDIVWDDINLNDLKIIYEQLDKFCTDIQTKIVKDLKKE